MAAPDDDMRRGAPHWVGRYELLVPIASGGMATVYLARTRGVGGFERDVAVKLTHRHLAEAPEFRAVLLEEAKLASAIRHVNVVSTLDIGEAPEGLFLVMDYVEGDSLSGFMRRSNATGASLPTRIGLRILLDALAGLHAAHQARDAGGNMICVAHRDFSPQNILVGVDGVGRLADFGIAKAASRAANTASGVIKGKVVYMSPEQARGERVDGRCDVWAAGVIAWELLAKRPMWPRNQDEVSTIVRLVTESAPKLSEVVPEIPADLADVVHGALAASIDARTRSAAHFAKALANLAEPLGLLADTSEVAEFVRSAVGPKLAERRLQVAATLKLREQLGAILESSVEALDASPAHIASARLASASVAGVALADDPPRTLNTNISPVVPRPPIAPAPRPPEPIAATEMPSTDIASTEKPTVRGRDRTARVLLGFGAAILLAGLVGLALRSRSPESPSALAPASPSAIASAPVQPAVSPRASVELAPVVLTETRADSGAPAPAAATVATTKPRPAGAPISQPVTPAAVARPPTVAAPAATSVKMAPDPYK